MYDSLINVNGNQVPTLEILLLLTIVALLPSLIIMMTSFSRTVIILSFLRNALGIQQTPPNMVLVGISLFLTLFIMDPVIKEINTEAYEPYKNQQITQEEALGAGTGPAERIHVKADGEKQSEFIYGYGGCAAGGGREPGRPFHNGHCPGVYDQRTQESVCSRILIIYSVSSDRHYRLQYVDVDGNDHASARDDLAAVQITSFYYCGRLELTVLDNCKKFSMKGRDC